MFLPDLFATLRRRWYLVVAGMVVTAVAGLAATQVPPRYYASEVVVMQPPVSPYAPNPMTGLYPSMAITGAAVAKRLSTPDAKARFRAAGVTGSYDFQPRNTGTNQEPRYVIGSMTVETVASDEDSGLRSLAILTGAFEQELESLQDRWKVARQLRITTAVLVPPSATLQPHSPSRALVGAGLLGTITTVAVTLWTDEVLRRRGERRQRRAPALAVR
ncbi:hypothetical protein [Micromonospora inositola]|uniref:Capsular polysaccharide biosynthesis protein n=1 Tax=Micromonospora inositola TaxID=47865 RepID=A0A1C5JDP0_9ACTN|nr:hypothetical protein [Micromonospora inositola]SCG68643.1 hypothetical protein GA0070613_4487 [Micromonospora inositola]